MRFQIIVNQSKTIYRIKYERETLLSKLKGWWTPYPLHEPQYVEVFCKDRRGNIAQFDSLKKAREHIEKIILMTEDENPTNWENVE